MTPPETSSTPMTLLHDLRSPLNAILGFSELLHDQVPGPLNEKQLKYIRQVLSASRTMLALLEQWPASGIAQPTSSDIDSSEIFPQSSQRAETDR